VPVAANAENDFISCRIMSGLLVVCLCAEWCGTCRDYHPGFAAMGKDFPRHRFEWIDIEDQADLVPDIEIENFPTLLVAQGEQLLFAGAMLPHVSHLRRLLLTLDENPAPQLGNLLVVEHTAFQALVKHLDSDRK
jgi:thioredoxin 1